MNQELLTTSKEHEMIQTNFKQEREHGDQMPYPIQSQIDILVENIQIYLGALMSTEATVEQIEQIKKSLITQLEFINSDFSHTEKLVQFSQTLAAKYIDAVNAAIQQEYLGFQKVANFGKAIKQLMARRADTQSEEQFESLNKMISEFLGEMETILLEDNYTVSRLEKYDAEDNNLQKSCSSIDKEVDQPVPSDHYWRKQKIGFRTFQPPKVFEFIQPPLHQVYISQATKIYHDAVPFKIKFVCLNSLDEPKIDTPNYFSKDIDPQKAVVHYCVPHTKKLITYNIDDIHKLLTIQKEYATQKQLAINWQFEQDTRTVITPQGRIFGINCRTTQAKQDSSLYQITTEKASNRGRVPQPKRNAAIVYCNKGIYVIGGNNQHEKCSSRNFKYSLKDKKWHQVSNSNVALRKPTVCTFRDRYIFKIGGLNQFDYINKVIQMYDTTTDKWSIVRANPKNVLEEVQILEDSIAVQIAEDQIYVFAGKNSNGYRHDTGLVFHLMEIREKIKAPAKVSGDLWNVSIGKKNILSFFGVFAQSNVIAHGNCLYPMRGQTCKLQRV